jgi:uncharacterized protein YcsI (UPF0317 family)
MEGAARRHVAEAIIAARDAMWSEMLGEPVAWGWVGHDGCVRDCIAPDTHAIKEGEYTVPLYALKGVKP